MSHYPHGDYPYDARTHTFHSPSGMSYPAPTPLLPPHQYHSSPNTSWFPPPGERYSPMHSAALPDRPNTLPPRPPSPNLGMSFLTPQPYAITEVPHQPQVQSSGQWRSQSLATPISHLHSPSFDPRSTSPFSTTSSDGRRIVSDSSGGRGSGSGKRNRRGQDVDGYRPERYKPRVGGPPKAKLGGPGGKTYDEMEQERALKALQIQSDDGIVASMTAEPKSVDGGEPKNEGKPSKWHGKPVGFRPPPDFSPNPSPAPILRVSASNIPLPSSPDRNAQQLQSQSAKDAGPVRKKWAKDVTLGLPDENGWEKLQAPPVSDADIPAAAGVPLPDSDAEDHGPAPATKAESVIARTNRSSIDLYRSGAIREPPSKSTAESAVVTTNQAKQDPPAHTAGEPQSPSPSADTGGAPLRRKGPFVGNAAFLRKQLGGVFNPERSAPGRHGRMSSSDGARRVVLESNAKPSAGTQHSVEVEVVPSSGLSNSPADGGALDAPELEDVPLTVSSSDNSVPGGVMPAIPMESGLQDAEYDTLGRREQLNEAPAISKSPPALSTSIDEAAPPESHAAADKTRAPESPVSRALRLIQSSLGSSRPETAQNAKRKQSDLMGDSAETISTASKPSPSVSPVDCASIGPKMGRYLQGQLSGFLKPEGQRTKMSSSPGTVLHGLDPFTMSGIPTSAEGTDTAPRASSVSGQATEKSNGDSGIEHSESLPPFGDSSLGLFTFTSALRPTAGTFKPRGAVSTALLAPDGLAVYNEPETSIRPVQTPRAPAFAPLGPRPPRDSSMDSSDPRQKRLRGDAPIFNPTSSGHTSRQSHASTQQSSSPVKMAFSSPLKNDSPLRLRPSAAAFVPAHISSALQDPPSPILRPLWARDSIDGNVSDLEVARRTSTQEPGDVLVATKALRSDATSFLPSELPVSPTTGKRTLSTSTLKAREAGVDISTPNTLSPTLEPTELDRESARNTKFEPEADLPDTCETSAAGASGESSSTNVSKIGFRGGNEAAEPSPVRPTLQPGASDSNPTLGTANDDDSTSPPSQRRDLPRSAAPSPDSRRLVNPATCDAYEPPEALAGSVLLTGTNLFYHPPVDSESARSDDSNSSADVNPEEQTAVMPITPIVVSSTTPSRSDTAFYATVDGSPLVPSRHITPTRLSSIVHSNGDHVLCDSPPGLSSPLASEPIPSPDASAAPTFRQPEIAVDDAADDRRFRKWVFPVSPEKRNRPPTLRRHTVPINEPDLESVLHLGEEGDLSSRLENLRETLSRGVRRSKPRPAMPFEMVGHNDAVLRKLDDLSHLVEHLRPVVAAPPALSLDGDDVRRMIVEMEGSILSTMRDTASQNHSDRASELTRVLAILQEQSTAIVSLQETSGVVADVHADLWTIEATHKTALAELSTAHEQAIAAASTNWSQASAEVAEMVQKLSFIETSQASHTKSLEGLLASQPVIQDLEAKLRSREEESASLRAELNGVKQKAELDEKRHKVVESKLLAVKSKLEAGKERERVSQRDFEDVLAGKMAAERARDELAEGMTGSMDTMRDQREELARLARELEEERSKPPPPPIVDPSVARLEAMQAASEILRQDLLGQFSMLSGRLDAQAGANTSESRRLTQQNERLEGQIATLREQLDALRTEKHNADLNAKAQIASSSSELQILRSELEAERVARKAAEASATELQETNERISEELLDSRMIARDRQAACRMNEVRLQALAQETHYWRHFALSYDRKEYRAFMSQNPNLLKQTNSAAAQNGASPELKTPAESKLHPALPPHGGTETPTKRSMTPIAETPSLLHNSDSSLEL